MRLKLTALGLMLPVAAVLSGCGMGTVATSSTAGIGSSQMIRGKAFGGQQPVANARIALYAYGSTGYGSSGTLLASTVTDAGGYYTIDPSTIQCPTPTTPVYLLSLGGDPGFGTNSAVALGAAIGNCSDAASAFVTVSEISTAALAYQFAHFFSSTNADGTTNDHFGSPASLTNLVTTANGPSMETLLDVENGYPRSNTNTFTFEGPKIITLGNILGNCVNSSGPGSPVCTALFDNTTVNGVRPSNILEAAVNIALHPKQNVAAIFGLQPQSGASAFTGGLSAAPADWTLSASYTSPNFGLALDARTVSTIDIDTSGHVWFPSNAPGKGGVGFFDPSAGGFSTLYTGNLTHPQQVAIDVDNYVWANDSATSNVAGFPMSNPSSPVTFTLPGTVSNSVTVAYDNSIRYGIVAPDGQPGLAAVPNTKNSYAEVPGAEIPGGGGFIASSLASDVIGGFAIGGQQANTPTTYDLYFGPNNSLNFVTYQSFQDSGQIAFTGRDFVGARGGYAPGADGICIWSQQGCFGMADATGVRHPSALSLDGAGSLWLSDTNGYTVEQIPFSNGSYLNGNGQANNTVFSHDPNNGGTVKTPAGIAIDGTGNVWVSNYGCLGAGCNPGSSFTLSEIIGVAAPTINPVSRQIVIDDLAGTQPQKKTAAGSSK